MSTAKINVPVLDLLEIRFALLCSVQVHLPEGDGRNLQKHKRYCHIYSA